MPRICQGKLQDDSRVKAELLNDFFSSVFTREDDNDIFLY